MCIRVWLFVAGVVVVIVDAVSGALPDSSTNSWCSDVIPIFHNHGTLMMPALRSLLRQLRVESS